MVISFEVEKARKYLETHGFVYTLRFKERKQVGKDWYNYFRTDIKRGNVFIKFVGIFCTFNKRLEPYVKDSGFNSLEEWLKSTKKANYLLLYKIIIIEQHFLNQIKTIKKRMVDE